MKYSMDIKRIDGDKAEVTIKCESGHRSVTVQRCEDDGKGGFRVAMPKSLCPECGATK